MGLSLLASVGFPIALFIYFRKRAGLTFMPVAMGAMGFFAFVLLLEQALHAFVLGGNEEFFNSHPGLYVLYGILVAGIFEETGRFVILMYMRKRNPGNGTGLAYGIGHGGLESILYAGLSMVSALAVSVSINSGNPDPSIPMESISALISASPYTFLWSGLERIAAISMHVSLSAIVWLAVTKRGKLWLYPVAIGLHALVDIPAAMAQAGLLTSIPLIEAFTALFAAFSVYAGWKTVSLYGSGELSYDPTPPAPAQAPPQQAAAPKTFTAADVLAGNYKEKDPWQDSDSGNVIEGEGKEVSGGKKEDGTAGKGDKKS
jgi:uncharacterized membrane protein YhfC